MPRIAAQTPLTTVRRPLNTGSNGSVRLCLTNHSAGAVLAKFYLVPITNESSTIADHMFWTVSCPANTTVMFSEHFSLTIGQKHSFQGEAGSDSTLVLTTLIG
mgnify:CR=1 FL=1